MKRSFYIIFGIIGAIILIWLGLRFSTPEDTWVKDSRGVYIKHGNPASTPEEVQNQQKQIETAQTLYTYTKSTNKDLSIGPCLGKADENTVVDIAHDPRQSIDDDPANQCPDFREGKALHFIELDPNGEIIRIQ